MSTPANQLGISTSVGGQGNVNVNYGVQPSAAPGAQGPLGAMSVSNAALLIIGAAGVGLVVLGYIFRKGPIQ